MRRFARKVTQKKSVTDADPLGLADLRELSKVRLHALPENPLIVHRRLPKKLRAQILASTPYENEDFLNKFEKTKAANDPKALIHLRGISTKRAPPDSETVGNILAQLKPAMGELLPNHIVEILQIAVKLRYPIDHALLSSFANSLLSRPDALNLASAVLALQDMQIESLTAALIPELTRRINLFERIDHLRFPETRLLLLAISRTPGMVVNQLALDQLGGNLIRDIKSVLDGRKLTFCARVASLLSQPVRIELLPKLSRRLDNLITNRIPVSVEDAIECLYGLDRLQMESIRPRWELFTRRMVEECGDLENAKKACLVRGIDSRFIRQLA